MKFFAPSDAVSPGSAGPGQSVATTPHTDYAPHYPEHAKATQEQSAANASATTSMDRLVTLSVV